MENSAVQQEYLFEGLHQALTFAYRYSGQQYSPSVLAQFMARSGGSGKCLHGLDGAAQAGLIRAIITHNLDIYEQNMIVAKFASNEKERIESQCFFVSVAIANMGTGLHRRRAADALVQKWFGLKIGVNDVAEEAGLHRSTISPAWRAVKGVMQSIWMRSEEQAYRELRDVGIIP